MATRALKSREQVRMTTNKHERFQLPPRDASAFDKVKVLGAASEEEVQSRAHRRLEEVTRADVDHVQWINGWIRDAALVLKNDDFLTAGALLNTAQAFAKRIAHTDTRHQANDVVEATYEFVQALQEKRLRGGA